MVARHRVDKHADMQQMLASQWSVRAFRDLNFHTSDVTLKCTRIYVGALHIITHAFTAFPYRVESTDARPLILVRLDDEPAAKSESCKRD